MLTRNTRTELERLLQARNEHPEKVDTIDAQIHETFTETHAIFVLDMAGFSRLTVRYGIIPFLAMIRRLMAIALPIIESHQGTLLKQDADNLFAVFPTVQQSADAAIELLKTLTAVNSSLPDSLDLHASIGIGYGEVLMIEGKDLYGNEMNLASKLGEDLARPNEILLTESAFAQLDQEGRSWEILNFSISGMNLATYKLLF